MSQSTQTWSQGESFLGSNRLADARAAFTTLLADPAWRLPAQLRLSRIALATGRLRDSVAHALGANEAREPDPVMLEAVCRVLVDNGELQAAIDCAGTLPLTETSDPHVLAGVGALLDAQSLPELAAPFCNRARELGLRDAPLLHMIGKQAMYAGDLMRADRELHDSLRVDADFAPAWRDLARLRRQTPDANHVEQLRAAIRRVGESHDAPLLHYALFKELDDLGDDGAWPALEHGMDIRRRQVTFDSNAEQALFDHLLRQQTERGVANEDLSGPTPIFIVGMPRSGTTVMERMIGAHSEVADAGELRDFNFQLRWLCDMIGPPQLDLALAVRAEDINWPHLADRYLTHTQWRANGLRFYTDKLPTNFFNIGYIARAIPHAKVLHLVRDPMDTCFSNLKELFGKAYPHSYEQIEMAEHFLRYRQLMAHWHSLFPGFIFDVDYNALVAEPESMSRRVLEFCGLQWEPEVLAFQSRGGSVATASAIQVRQAIDRRFTGQWRRYASQLEPMRERLEAGHS